MDVSKVLRMNGGVGETSYGNNSLLQSAALSKTEHIKKEAISRMYRSCVSVTSPPCLCIADLGCSSGPNALLAVHQLMHAVDDIRQESGHRGPPDILVLLNDLPDSDFNTLFRSLPCFRKQLESETGRCFFNGVPGSFYGPLFPRESVHFVHSSYSLHCLSRAPENIGMISNKGELWLSRNSPESVLEAYFEQFKADFSTFLECRSEEMVTGGCMVFTLLGRQNDDHSIVTDAAASYTCWSLLSLALRQMVSEGLIEEEKLDAFNLPAYTPSEREIRNEVEKQGSFSINCVEASEVGWEHAGAGNGEEEELHTGMLGVMRAVAEPLLAEVFGGELMDGLFSRYADILRDAMSKRSCTHLNLTVSLSKLYLV